MTKCDFCTESNEKGKCYWEYQSSKREHCEKAIDRMSKALGQDSSKKKTACLIRRQSKIDTAGAQNAEQKCRQLSLRHI